MNPLTVIKFVANLAISFGIGNIVGNVIKTNSPTNVNLLRKIAIGIGSFFLSSMITDKVVKHSEEYIDDTAQKLRDLKKSLKGLASIAKAKAKAKNNNE